MTEGEKLVLIAENEQRVYDSGYNDYVTSIWDVIQGKRVTGEYKRTDWSYAFYYWYAPNAEAGKKAFHPIADIKPTSASQMFFACELKFNLQERLDELGVTLDFSACKQMLMAFYACNSPRIGVIDLTSASASGVQRMFESSKIVTIDELIFNESTAYNYSGMFSSQTTLENIKIGGKITQNGFNVSTCTKLTHDSLINDDGDGIINSLKEYTDGSTHTITLGSTNLAKLTDAEKAVATQKGWTLL